MPTYCVGKEIQSRTSFREILCEQCSKSMGRIYATRIPERLEGLSPQDILTFYPSMKLDIQIHEKECRAQKKDDGSAEAVNPDHG
jgi:NMD protein affecting ribosome stability and mRNA decay